MGIPAAFRKGRTVGNESRNREENSEVVEDKRRR